MMAVIFTNTAPHNVWVDGRLVLPGDRLILSGGDESESAALPDAAETPGAAEEGSDGTQETEPEPPADRGGRKRS